MKNVVLVGVADDEKARFEALLRQARAQLGHVWRMAVYEQVDFVVVDLAHFSGRVARVRAQDERKPFAVLADADGDTLGANFVLRRPLSADTLAGVLNRVFEVPAAVAAPAQAPAGVRAIRASAEIAPVARASFENVARTRICTDIDKLLQRGGAQLIERAGLPSLVLDPLDDNFYTTAQLSELEPYLLDVVKSGECRPISGTRLAAFRESTSAHPLARLRWLGALLSSNGWLASHLDPGGTYRVKSWISMDGDYRRQYRIATTMLRPAPLHHIAAAANATMAEVFDVTNAYDAVGLLEWTPRRSRHAPPEVVADRAERSHARTTQKKMKRLLAATVFPR